MRWERAGAGGELPRDESDGEAVCPMVIEAERRRDIQDDLIVSASWAAAAIRVRGDVSDARKAAGVCPTAFAIFIEDRCPFT